MPKGLIEEGKVRLDEPVDRLLPELANRRVLNVAHRATVASASNLLTGAGFTVAETITDSFRMRFADGSSLLNHYFIRFGFMDGWKSIAPPDAMVGTFEALERNLNIVARARGDLTLTIPMAFIDAFKTVVTADGQEPAAGSPSTR